MKKTKRRSHFASAERNFTKFPNKLIQTPNLSAAEKFILLYISSMGTCFASHATMAKLAGCSVSNIKRILNRLQKRSLINWARKKRGTNTYEITHSDNWDLGVNRDDELTTSSELMGHNDLRKAQGDRGMAHRELADRSERATIKSKYIKNKLSNNNISSFSKDEISQLRNIKNEDIQYEVRSSTDDCFEHNRFRPKCIVRCTRVSKFMSRSIFSVGLDYTIHSVKKNGQLIKLLDNCSMPIKGYYSYKNFELMEDEYGVAV